MPNSRWEIKGGFNSLPYSCTSTMMISCIFFLLRYCILFINKSSMILEGILSNSALLNGKNVADIILLICTYILIRYYYISWKWIPKSLVGVFVSHSHQVLSSKGDIFILGWRPLGRRHPLEVDAIKTGLLYKKKKKMNSEEIPDKYSKFDFVNRLWIHEHLLGLFPLLRASKNTLYFEFLNT